MTVSAPQYTTGLWTETSLLELQLMAAAFVLCSLIGIERQVHLKAAGYRTHVLVGVGAAAFTLISAWGFRSYFGDTVGADTSRIAAQVVTGIGFLGAGVIFKGRSVIRGLTTAASIWVAAAVGMACGAGMLSLAIGLTVFHLLTLFVFAPLARKIPSPGRRRVLRVTYLDGHGVLRGVLKTAAEAGFASTILRTERREEGAKQFIMMDVKFSGKRPIALLVPLFAEIPGVERVFPPPPGTDEEDDHEDSDDEF